jgi:hypothetical protein
MQTIEFLRNFFTKGLEIHSSFYCVFLDFFFKILKISISQFFKISIFQNFKFGNHRILNLKNCQILNRNQKVNPTAGKSTCQGDFRIVL